MNRRELIDRIDDKVSKKSVQANNYSRYEPVIKIAIHETLAAVIAKLEDFKDSGKPICSELEKGKCLGTFEFEIEKLKEVICTEEYSECHKCENKCMIGKINEAGKPEVKLISSTDPKEDKKIRRGEI
jgi:hypothetical protein